MDAKTLRHLIIGLLTITGIFHLAVALLNIAPAVTLPIAIFGVIYTALGFFVRKDTKDGSKSHSRNAIFASIGACTLGLTLGGSNYIANGGPMALPIMFAIDVAIIVAGIMWIMKTSKRA